MAEADRWLYEMRRQDEFGDGIDAEDPTVDEWFTFWHTELIKDLAANTQNETQKGEAHALHQDSKQYG